MESQRVQEAPSAVDTLRERRAERRRRANRWYYPVFAATAAIVVLAFATGEPWVRNVAVFAMIAVNAVTGYLYRAATQAPMPRLWQGPATLYALPLLGFLIAGVLLAHPAVEAAHSFWPAWAMAVAVFAAALIYGSLFERATRLSDTGLRYP